MKAKMVGVPLLIQRHHFDVPSTTFDVLSFIYRVIDGMEYNIQHLSFSYQLKNNYMIN